MKLIEGMKLCKELQVKADDLRKKIAQHSAHLSVETPVYADQIGQIKQWLQSHEDTVREIAKLLFRITKTNVTTQVTIEVGGNKLTKSITEWIARRRTLAKFDEQAWSALTDRNLREGAVPSSAGGQPTIVSIKRCYDPVERDKKIEIYRNEPHLIDRTLEVINAVTDMVE